MVKPILILGGAIPIIIAILIVGPLVMSPEIPITAVDPNDIVQIEFTKHKYIAIMCTLQFLFVKPDLKFEGC